MNTSILCCESARTPWELHFKSVDSESVDLKWYRNNLKIVISGISSKNDNAIEWATHIFLSITEIDEDNLFQDGAICHQDKTT